MSPKRPIRAFALATAAITALLTAQAGPASAAAALDPGSAPGGNFTLTHWELQLPTGTTNHTTTIPSSKLVGAGGYQDKYFYTASADGAMTFWDPENGVTLGSKYPRTELRELNSSGQEAEWTPSGTNTLSATLKVTKVPDHVAVGQIHLDNSSGSSKPLLELYYYKNGDVRIGIEQTPAGGNQIPYTVANVPLGSKWSYTIGLSGSKISLTVNGSTRTWTMSSTFNGYKMYFKAGDYDQSVGSSSTIGANVGFYALKLAHS